MYDQYALQSSTGQCYHNIIQDMGFTKEKFTRVRFEPTNHWINVVALNLLSYLALCSIVGCIPNVSILVPRGGAVSSIVWVQIPIMTLVPLSKAFNYNCFIPGPYFIELLSTKICLA